MNEELVTASQVAERAGVGASAVSNWRKRFPDFPPTAGVAPSGGDLFRWSEVQSWLESRGRTPKPAAGARAQLFAVMDRLRGRALAGDIGETVAICAAFLTVARELGSAAASETSAPSVDLQELVVDAISAIETARPELASVFSPMRDLDPDDLRMLLDTVAAVDSLEELATTVDLVLERTTRYGEFRTDPELAALLVELAEPSGVVFDPAAGSGELLLRAGTRDGTTLYGQDLNVNAWRLAMARSVLHQTPIHLAVADSSTENWFPDLLADVVLCEPPAGMHLADDRGPSADPRWKILGSLERPPSRAADFAWLAVAIDHLAGDGRGYLLLRAGSLFRGGSEARMRAELLRQGTVEAIITVAEAPRPTGQASHAIWVVRRPDPTATNVLLVAGENVDQSEVPQQIAETLNRWREDGSSFEPTNGISATVPVLELLAGDAALVPARWVYDSSAARPEEAIADAAAARLELEDDRVQVVEGIPEFRLSPTDRTRPRTRVADLIDGGLVSLVRPSRLKTSEYQDHGIPVWVPADVHPAWSRENEPKFADPDLVDPRAITEPGDIVITTIGGLRTRVDTEGGHVLGTSLQALRLTSGTLDPRVVASLLPSEANQRLITGTTIPRVNVRELEIPLLEPSEGADLIRLLDAIDEHQQAAHRQSQAAAGLRAALVAALSTGAAELSIDDGVQR